jgi:uncharacterized protein YcfJ
MKNLFWALCVVAGVSFLSWNNPVYAEAVAKKVCHEDAKTKKQVCKTVKTHKKVEGTKVPDAPAKKSTKK